MFLSVWTEKISLSSADAEFVNFPVYVNEIFSYQRCLPTASLRLKGYIRDTLNTTLGKFTDIALVCEFCDIPKFMDSENGVPAQLLEYEIEELVCVARMSLSEVAEYLLYPLVERFTDFLNSSPSDYLNNDKV